MSDLQITVNVLSAIMTNCYFITNKKTCETIITDPASDAHIIRERCEKAGLKPIAVLLTHGHFDHISAAADIKEIYGIPIYAALDEKNLLSDAALNCSALIGKKVEITADNWLNDNDIIELAGLRIKVIHTPGHTAGSVCYYIESENVLISGDTLFQNGIGRTDLPTGDYNTLESSINNKLFTLPGDTVVYPGHGGSTAIKQEKGIPIL